MILALISPTTCVCVGGPYHGVDQERGTRAHVVSGFLLASRHESKELAEDRLAIMSPSVHLACFEALLNEINSYLKPVFSEHFPGWLVVRV